MGTWPSMSKEATNRRGSVGTERKQLKPEVRQQIILLSK
jgi:hypothetical protein